MGIWGYYVGISKGLESLNQRFQSTENVSDWITTHQSVIGGLPLNNYTEWYHPDSKTYSQGLHFTQLMVSVALIVLATSPFF